jgi:class 3 adenylate cyclase
MGAKEYVLFFLFTYSVVTCNHYVFKKITWKSVMSLKDDLSLEVTRIFSSQWDVQTTTTAPAAEDLRLDANHAKKLDSATVLYADLDGSTNMVDSYEWQFSAEVYETYLRCAAKIIRAEGGVITAYDGDRVMAIFTGNSKNTSAATCAMKINFAVSHVIQPALKLQYPKTAFELNHVVGIDTSQLHAARIGVKGDNDLVWIGRAANYAAKLTNLTGDTTWITQDVYDQLNDTRKYIDGKAMWTKHNWTPMNNMTIYSSDYWWRVE